MQDEHEHTEKVCPNCSAVFTCSPSGCWCSELPQIMPMNPEAGCLCPACLKKAIDEKMANVDS